MLDLKRLFDIAKDASAVVGAGYLVHKIYVGVEFVEAKAKAVKTALVGPATTTPAPAAKTVAKS